MLDDVFQRREPAVVVEAALVDLLGVEQGSQRRRHVAPLRPAIGLETVDADLVGGVEVVARAR